ncbi:MULTISPECIES: hypothetical protein [unclassified Thalassotalea]|uniref:hypothetical protein n=1 Tax=unclassified Thalassotalea TaxID=2614972 RepID=UPI0010821AB8|nr:MULTISPECIES: hypothetical protein [unclassified Thalassotalea]NMP16933.1 hypothetical protein [Thalassotalea sp. Y01]QBY04493.1 hypothetical protein E2K93_08865 [Thalassotalea sp. HSM 43]
MKLIMRTEFDDLRLNENHAYDVDSNGDKQIVKIYCDEKLIAKKVTQKKSIRYFGVKEYQDYLSEEYICE